MLTLSFPLHRLSAYFSLFMLFLLSQVTTAAGFILSPRIPLHHALIQPSANLARIVG